MIDGELTTLLALPPEEGGYANDPILGRRREPRASTGGAARRARDLRRRPRRDDPLHRHERGRHRRLADHVLDGELPADARRSSAGCTRGSRRRGSRSCSSRASRRSWSSCPGDVDFVGTLYSFGATLSFTVAHASMVAAPHAQAATAELALPRAAEPPLARRRLAAVRDLRRARDRALASLVIVVQNPTTRWVGLGWIVLGFVGYVVYRRRCVRAPLTRDREGAAGVRRRRSRSSTGASSSRSSPGRPSDDALDVACRLAAERGARDRRADGARGAARAAARRRPARGGALANDELDEAVAIGDSYGVRVVGAPRPRAERRRRRSSREARAARARRSSCIGAPRQDADGRRRGVFGATVDYVLRQRALPRDGHGGAGAERGVSWYRQAVVVFGAVFVVIGVALLVVTAVARRRRRRLPARRRCSSRSASARIQLERKRRPLMARKVRGFERVLDAPALFAIAYGEIGSSIYFALGIVAGHGARPDAASCCSRPGLLFLRRRALVRRGDRRDPRDGRRRDVHAPRVQRPRRLRHRLGAVPRLPDRDRALGAVPAALPRRARSRSSARATARGTSSSRSSRSRRSAACGSSAARGCTGRRSSSPLLDLVVAVLARRPRARARLLAGRARRAALARRRARTGSTTSRSRCRSRCSPTPASRRSRTSPRRRASPGRTLPRSLFSAIGARRRPHRARSPSSGVTAFPAEDGTTELGDEWLEAPLVGIVDGVRRRAARGARRRAARRRSGSRGALDPPDGGHDVDLRAARASRTRWASTACCRARSAASSAARSSRREAIAAIARHRDRDRRSSTRGRDDEATLPREHLLASACCSPSRPRSSP